MKTSNPLRRITTKRAAPMQALDLEPLCEQCGRYRAHGNHQRCSKRRQEQNQHRHLKA